jgi:hypothetical protein
VINVSMCSKVTIDPFVVVRLEQKTIFSRPSSRPPQRGLSSLESETDCRLRFSNPKQSSLPTSGWLR